jgi:predicted metal-dependent hydrolase
MNFLRPAILPDHVIVAGTGGPLRVLLRRNPRARRYSLRVSQGDGTPVLTLPPRGSLATAASFLEKHVGWLESRLAALPPRISFADGSLVPIRGVPHRIACVGGRGLVRADADGAERRLVVSGDPAHAGRRVRDHLVKLCRGDMEEAVRRHAATLGVKPTAIRLKDTKGRWGSATAKGVLAFSWRLIMAPPFVLDYLAAHEVAHLREMNHGPRFWSHVQALCADTDAARAWLKRHGAGLLAYG